MDPETLRVVTLQGEQLNRIEQMVRSTRNYFRWTLIITIGLFVLPIIGLLFAVPALIATYSAIGSF